ncbi:hypothetical protein [Acinetobacter sp.]|uniref:hypothetical protein n=1 Tax=Acinetobacter sp. TaxID=472 RepID=UPI003890FDE7
MIKIRNLALFSALGVSACTDSTETYRENVDIQYYQDNSKTGDLIVWGISPDLIIKTYVGEKNRISEDTVLSSPFLGQFPISFEPSEQFMESHDHVENVADFQNPMQFNLLLNNANNIEINNFYDKNYQNQVKVHVQNFSTADPLSFQYKRTPREWINYLIPHQFVQYEKAFKKVGLECYSMNFDSGISYHCLGRASDPQKTEFLMKIIKNNFNQRIVITTIEAPMYPNVRVEWTMPYESLKDWKDVDQNIWRLLDIWNVSQSRK